MMNKKEFYLIIILLLSITGCSNVKSIGRWLSKEEKIINTEKINYLENEYKDVNVNFIGRLEGSSSCKCIKPFLDGTCLKYECDIVDDKFVWQYRVCSNKTKLFCLKLEYDDVKGEWKKNNFKDDFVYNNEIMEILDNHNIEYSTYTYYRYLKELGSQHFTIIIKKEKNIDNLVNAIIDINIKLGERTLKTNHTDIIAFNDDDYNYITKHISYKSDISSKDDIYEKLTGERRHVDIIEVREINSNMFECESSDFERMSYSIDKDRIGCMGY